MKMAIVIKYEKDVLDLIVILAKNGYRVSVEKMGNDLNHGFFIEVSDENILGEIE